MKSKRFSLVFVAAGILAALLAACTSAVAVPPTEPTAMPTVKPTVEPTEAPTEAPTAAPTEASDNPIPVDGPLAVIYRHGGLCVTGGECQSTMTIQNDGAYEVIVNGQEPKQGSLTAEQVAQLNTLIGETDFDKILNTPFTGTCPSAYDGQESVYTFYQTGGALDLASCTVTIDPSAPLFAMLDQLFADATTSE